MDVDANCFQNSEDLFSFSAFRNSACDEKGSATEYRVFDAVIVLLLREARTRG